MTMKFSIRNAESTTELSDRKATELDISWTLESRAIRISIYKDGLIEIQDGKDAYAIEKLGTDDVCLLTKAPVGVEYKDDHLYLKLKPGP